VIDFAAVLPGSWEDVTSQFVQDCYHSQATVESADSAADVWNQGFAVLAVLYASFNCDNRFVFVCLIFSISAL